VHETTSPKRHLIALEEYQVQPERGRQEPLDDLGVQGELALRLGQEGCVLRPILLAAISVCNADVHWDGLALAEVELRPKPS
jgi:hypothetical protein